MLIICVLQTGAFIVLFLTPLGILTGKITQEIVRQSLKRKKFDRDVKCLK